MGCWAGIAGTQQKTVFGYEVDFVPQRVTTRGARAYVCYEGLGREVKSLSRVSATAWDVVDKVYSGFGEAMRVSNSYRVEPGSEPGDLTISGLGGSGQVWNNTLYDDLGRVKQEEAAGQASTSYTFAPGTVTLQDPAGKIWRREFDGLGRYGFSARRKFSFTVQRIAGLMPQFHAWRSWVARQRILPRCWSALRL